MRISTPMPEEILSSDDVVTLKTLQMDHLVPYEEEITHIHTNVYIYML